MDPRQSRIKQIFSDAIDLQEPERSVFLDSACQGDAEMRAEVEKLLSSFHEPEQLLDRSLGSILFAGVESPSTLSEGDVIAERFRVIRLIGRGGMGEVYEADDPQRGESVAIKTLRQQFMLSAQLHARFRREIQLARKITHENVCEIYDFGSQRIRETDVEYVTMKFLPGATLAQRLESGRMPLAEVTPIIEQVASGLAALHKVGVTHRDLKPANIMLTPCEDGERAVIMDFGLAQSFAPETREETLTFSGQLLGTPAYMAPEQLKSEPCGPETDIYALGVVMYQMLSGRRPFEANNMFEAAAQKLAAKPEPLSAYIDIDRDWERLVERCLERERSARFQNVAEFLEQLRILSKRKRRWLRVPRRLRSLTRTKRWRLPTVEAIRRRPVLSSTLVVALMAIVAPMQIPAFRTSALRKGCLAFPGNSLLCELPPDKGIAVLPFEVSGVSPDDEALARGAARYIRESLSRLAPDHSQMCVHLRPDKLAEGVALALEGKIHGSDQGTSVTLVIRESRAAKGSPHPIVLRRLERVFDRQQTPDLVASTLMVIADALELRFPAKEWAAWSRSNPRDADSMVSYLSGLGWLETKAYEQAAKAFNAVINPTLNFNFAPAHVGLGDAHRLLFNRTKDEVSALRARQAYQRAIPLDRDFGFAGAEKSLAELEIATGQPEAAITHYKSALKLWPFDQNVQKRLVSALESGGRVDEAFTVLEQAAKETPRCWLSHNALASLYSRHGRLRDAEASLLEVVRLAPFNATAYHNLAFDYLKLGRYDDAVEMSSKAVEFSGSPLAYSTLGRGFLEKGCQQDALLNLRRAIESDENSFIVWANLADALQQIQPGTSAAAAASVRTADLSRKALESTPNAALQAAQCGLNLARCGRASEAVPYLIRARRDGSLDSGVLLTAAEGLHLASEREKAMDALKTAVERGATPHELKSRAGLAPLLDDARSAGLLTNTTVNDKADAGGLITQRPAGCPGWIVPGKGLRVN